MRVHLSNEDVINIVAARIRPHAEKIRTQLGRLPAVFGVPRGGVPIAYALGAVTPIRVVSDAAHADLIVDDVVDSGRTRRAWCEKYPGVSFIGAFERGDTHEDDWLVFPWEASVEASIEDNIVRLLQFVGEDPQRGGLLETPKRVAAAWQDWTKGYSEDAASVLKVFEDGGEAYDEMVTVRDIPFYSQCEHHLAPFFGTATISYIPTGKIVGLSKLSRLVDVFARRLQVQERLTAQIADALELHLQPKGVGVRLQARHLCMESRGVRQQGHSTVTTALRGVIKDDGAARAEFLAGCR